MVIYDLTGMVSQVGEFFTIHPDGWFLSYLKHRHFCHTLCWICVFSFLFQWDMSFSWIMILMILHNMSTANMGYCQELIGGGHNHTNPSSPGQFEDEFPKQKCGCTAPVDRWFMYLLIHRLIGFQPSKVVQDFFHPPYQPRSRILAAITGHWCMAQLKPPSRQGFFMIFRSFIMSLDED